MNRREREDVCQEIEARLLEGERLAGHPRLLDHAGSCLDCFRTLTELRDLPRIAELMRAGAAELGRENDPGPAFWKAMPDRIADDVLGLRPKTETPRRLWWRPVGFASIGLAAAAMALVAFYRPMTTTNTTTTGAAPAAAATLTAVSDTDDNLPVPALANLNATELRALNHRLTQEELGASLALGDPGTDVISDEDGDGTALERLSSLGEPELQRLTHSLGLELE